MSRGFRNGQGAAGFFQLETDRHGLGLVIGLLGQPAPGQGRPGADTADQGSRALELLQRSLQGLLLQGAVVLGQDHLDDLRLAATAQGHQLLVVEGFFGRGGNNHPGLGFLAGNDIGQGRAISLAQVFNRWLRCGAIPPPIAACSKRDQNYQGKQQKPPGTMFH